MTLQGALFSDLTGDFNTPLSATETDRFKTWRQHLPENLQNMRDYDLQGAWKADAKEAGNGHLPDRWKKPNHVTFSSGSQYSSPENPGGDWRQGEGDQWVFWASPADLKYHDASALIDYWNRTEGQAGNTLVLPLEYRLPTPPPPRRVGPH